MIIVYTKDGRKLQFEVPCDATVVAAWHAMGGDPAYAAKAFKFTTKEGGAPEIIKVQIGAIKSLISVVDAIYEPVLEELTK